MITVTIDEKDKFVVKQTVNYLLALIGESRNLGEHTVKLEIDASEVRKMIQDAIDSSFSGYLINGTSDKKPNGIFSETEIEELSVRGQKRDLAEFVNSIKRDYVEPTFNKQELAEAEALAQDPTAIFGKKPDAPSTVDAVASSTVLEVTSDNTSLPAPTTVFGQNVQTPVSEVSHVAPPTANPAVPVDSAGMVWDARIHSSSREKVKDGTWRKKRGVDATLVTQVEAEIRSVQAIVPAPTLAAVPDAPVDMTFNQLLDAIVEGKVAGTITQAQIDEALQATGVRVLPDLMINPALIPTFRTLLGGVVW